MPFSWQFRCIGQAQMSKRTISIVSGVAFIVAASDFALAAHFDQSLQGVSGTINVVNSLIGRLIAQIAVSRPSVATPNARVADAFSAIPLNVTTVLTNAGAAFPTPVIEAKFDTRSSANAIVATEFSAAAPDAVMPSDVTSSLRQGRMSQVASLEAAPPENEATPQQDRPLAASPNPDEGGLAYLKYYV